MCHWCHEELYLDKSEYSLKRYEWVTCWAADKLVFVNEGLLVEL